MNLKSYFQKLRELETSLTEPYIVVISQVTADGGREGLLTEVPREVGAKMIADGRAQVASEDTVKDFQEKKAEAKRIADAEAASKSMQVTLVPTADLMRAKRTAKE
jgi:phage terminase Nu1 subunit (DNA packaging protein)